MFARLIFLPSLALLASCSSPDQATSQSESEAVPASEGMVSSPDFKSDRQSPLTAPNAETATGDLPDAVDSRSTADPQVGASKGEVPPS